jgi:uncharacterized spore protein YtfJ
VKLDQLITTARDAITVKRVFAEPCEKEGVTVITAASLAGGAGGGGGHDDRGQEGEGGGFGLSARPAGAYVIKEGKVVWRPAVDVQPANRSGRRRRHRVPARPGRHREERAKAATRIA